MPRSIAIPPWTEYQSITALPLRNQCNGRSWKPRPPDPELEVLTAELHNMPPYGYGKLGKHPAFVSYSYLKDSEFPAVKRDASL